MHKINLDKEQVFIHIVQSYGSLMLSVVPWGRSLAVPLLLLEVYAVSTDLQNKTLNAVFTFCPFS